MALKSIFLKNARLLFTKDLKLPKNTTFGVANFEKIFLNDFFIEIILSKNLSFYINQRLFFGKNPDFCPLEDPEKYSEKCSRKKSRHLSGKFSK